MVSQALIQKCDLTRWDPSGETAVWIRQAKYAEVARMRSLFSERKVQTDEEGHETHIFNWPEAERSVLACWLSFEDASIMRDAGDGKPEPMFHKGMSEKEFRAAFDELDYDLVQDWMKAVVKVNPQWAWSDEELQGN
jgi:hypothetical protein